ncbi:hypothetical protein [Komagataeibacter medellinensis]|uniref:hypothetical protein n=1 Tax=Komagataeibacter medellinensis TaxID=1177712 RepID=UPI001E3E79D1|nr:hypothetical protein [Komagataeibacter medellinensis]
MVSLFRNGSTDDGIVHAASWQASRAASYPPPCMAGGCSTITGGTRSCRLWRARDLFKPL